MCCGGTELDVVGEGSDTVPVAVWVRVAGRSLLGVAVLLSTAVGVLRVSVAESDLDTMPGSVLVWVGGNVGS